MYTVPSGVDMINRSFTHCSFNFDIQKTNSATSASSNPKQVSAASAPIEQKKKATLKAKSKSVRKPGSEGHVLGGADYVELMMGGRRKAKEEAAKLPKDDDDVDM